MPVALVRLLSCKRTRIRSESQQAVRSEISQPIGSCVLSAVKVWHAPAPGPPRSMRNPPNPSPRHLYSRRAPV